MTDDKRHLNSLKRGLAALRILNTEKSLTIADLARRLGEPRKTAERVLDTLLIEGYVYREADGRSFALADQVRKLALGYNRDSLIAEVARPILRDLCKQTLNPVGLTTPLGAEVVVRVSMDFDAPHALERLTEGTTFPVNYDPTGHVYLAHCSEDVRCELIDLGVSAIVSQNTAQHKTPSSADLEAILQDGYSFSSNRTRLSGEAVLAVPVYSKDDYVASLYMRMPKRVFSPDTIVKKFLPKLQFSAHLISTSIACRLDASPANLEGIDRPLLVSDKH